MQKIPANAVKNSKQDVEHILNLAKPGFLTFWNTLSAHLFPTSIRRAPRLRLEASSFILQPHSVEPA